MAFDLGQARPGLGRVPADLGDRRAVLPAQLPHELPAGAHGREALGIGDDRFAGMPDVVCEFGDLGLQCVRPRRQFLERLTARQCRDRIAQRVLCGAGERALRVGERLAVGVGVGEQALLPFEPSLLVVAFERRGLDLAELVPQEVGFPGERAFVAAEPGEFVFDPPDLGAGIPEVLPWSPCRVTGERVEQCALFGRVDQRLVRVLPVQIGDLPSVFGQFTDGREPAVHVRAAPPVARHDPREHDLVIAVDEPALDPRFGGTVAHEGGVGAASEEQHERIDQQRLARPGFTGDGGHPRTEADHHLGDDAQVLDPQFAQHGVTAAISGPGARTWLSGSGGSRAART